MLGPDPLGHFQPVAVKSIHRKRMPVKEVRSGQTASFALKKVFDKALHCVVILLSLSIIAKIMQNVCTVYDYTDAPCYH